jgi:hypothetical protein
MLLEISIPCGWIDPSELWTLLYYVLTVCIHLCLLWYGGRCIHWWPFLGMPLPEMFVTYNVNSISLRECACVYSFELSYFLPMSIK